MRRVHLFEFGDQAWVPAFVRDLLTGSLQFGITRFGFYAATVPLIAELLEHAADDTVVDLCSGGTGPWLMLAERLRTDGYPELRVTFTDKFVNKRAGRHVDALGRPYLRYHDASVDATDVPETLGGTRTLFTSFHHFLPADARAILADAARRRAPIGIFEFTERTPSSLLAACLVPLAMLLATPWMRPLTWRRLLLTYVVPVVPLFSLWDGIVSSLRSYLPTELDALARSVAQPGYRFRSGRLRGRAGSPTITYLLGHPDDGPCS